jgi:hypothetical protein
MPWRECSKMDERLRFVARLLEGEKMAELCREFDISRKTGLLAYSDYPGCSSCRRIRRIDATRELVQRSNRARPICHRN